MVVVSMRGTLIAIAMLAAVLALPTAAADDVPTGTGVEGNCVVVYDFPDAGLAVCKGRADCVGGLYTRRTTFTGTEEECLV